MIVEKKHPTNKRFSSWLQAILLVSFVIWLVWYLTQAISISEIVAVFQQTQAWAVWAGFGMIVLTTLMKTWRWQLIFMEKPPTYWSTFLALSLGQYINLIFPFLRLGEVARIYLLHQKEQQNEAVILSTIAIEKTLDLVMLAGTGVFILPLLTLANLPTVSPVVPIAIAFFACLLLYLLAYQTALMTRWSTWTIKKFPERIGFRLQKWVTAGLQGLSALRNPRRVAILVGTSLFINLLSIATPYLLFLALNMPLGIAEAAVIFVGGTLVAIPATTPAKVGVFEWSMMFILQQLGIESQSIQFSYALLIHIVVFLPQILFGIIATWQSNWDYQTLTS